MLLAPSIDALRSVMLSSIPGLPQPDAQLQFPEYARRGRVGVALGRLAREEGERDTMCLSFSRVHSGLFSVLGFLLLRSVGPSFVVRTLTLGV